MAAPQSRRGRRSAQEQPALSSWTSGIALLTIFAIVGTLCGCGRYGKPVRPTAPATAVGPMEIGLAEADTKPESASFGSTAAPNR